MSYKNQTDLLKDLTYELSHKSRGKAIVCLLESDEVENLKTDVVHLVDLLYEEGLLDMPLSHQKYLYLDDVADYTNMVYLDMYIEDMNRRSNDYNGVLIFQIAEEMKNVEEIMNLKLLIQHQKAQLIFMLSKDSLKAFDSLGRIHTTLDHHIHQTHIMN